MACIPIRDIANCCLTMCRIRDPGVRFPGHRQGRKQLWTAGPQDANHHIREYHQFGRMRKRVKSHRHGKASPTRLKLARNGWPPEGLLPRGGFADCRAWFGVDRTRQVEFPSFLQLAWDGRSQQIHHMFGAFLPGLPWRSDFPLRVPGVARRKERGGICPHFSKVATHERCAHRSARPCHVQAQELGGYICILIGGVGRRRSERESGEMLCEFGVAPCPLSRYTLVHRSDKPAQRKKYQYSCYHRSSINPHAFLNFPTKSFGRTSDVTWSRLCS